MSTSASVPSASGDQTLLLNTYLCIADPEGPMVHQNHDIHPFHTVASSE